MEKRGVPTVTLFTQAFEGLATAVATGQNMPALRRVIFPHPLNDRPEEDIRAALSDRLDGVVQGLVRD
ncbi:MAG: hypothetical protein M3400_15985 [Actinomycetota bacterium]|nr:hypothetical protein [Actinomycetota bacterium]